MLVLVVAAADDVLSLADPGDMDAALMSGAKGVRIEHLAMPAQAAAELLLARNAAAEKLEEEEERRFGALVCDVNADARFVVQELLLPLAPLLACADAAAAAAAAAGAGAAADALSLSCCSRRAAGADAQAAKAPL